MMGFNSAFREFDDLWSATRSVWAHGTSRDAVKICRTAADRLMYVTW